jgi:phosphoribosylformimino-5-aminoimidazole carboxamide ribotide isomerase
MTQFRPCIDLHQGRVKQIVGGTLRDQGEGPRTNFVSDKDAAYFAALYREDGLKGGHVIMLGAGNEQAALGALHAYPLGLQIGGGIDPDSAKRWLDAGASHVIVTSWIFPEGEFSESRLHRLSQLTGPERLVLDLSCRVVANKWFVTTNRWQTITSQVVDSTFLERLAPYCAEFLIHAADVEGLQAGMDIPLIRLLAAWGQRPITYAGGARHLEDLHLCETESNGHIDLTIGSALDLFGGQGARYLDCVAFNRRALNA